MKKLLITVNGKRYEVDVEVLEDDDVIQTQPAFRPPTRSIESYSGATPVALSPRSKKKETLDQKTLASPLNGVVLEVKISDGQDVTENDVVIVVEAMKMKTNIASPFTAKVKKVHVKEKDVIEQGHPLLTYE
ncbi:MAG: acetyl-CoA carboxylase biotin carboxyl carrier protein subunit [Ignavibacteriae bacterium]|nr:acetyl-CoA carboxylase biotin carboxyl carrier protein subunit [Ignavibacteriota bacterium]